MTEVRWRRGIVESVLIILSILLAFGIDALWDASQERSKERDYVEALRVEMDLAAAELEEDFGRREVWRATSDSILAEIDQRSASDSLVTAWVQESVMRLARFFPPSSVLDDLVSSGNLALLTSNELRFALLSYQRGRERVNFLGDWGLNATETGLRPYLVENFQWSSVVLAPITLDGRLPEDPLSPAPVPPQMMRAMLNDPVFKNLMLIHRQRLQIVQRRSVQLAELIEDVIGLLDSEVERLGGD